MLSLYKSKLVPVLISFVRSAPILVITSMGFRFLFIAMQVLSIWFIFGWVGGKVNGHVLDIIGLPAVSYVYLCIGAAGFISATLFSLLSKISILKATFKFERVVVEQSLVNGVIVTKGDLKSIVKLIISIMDVAVPLGMILLVSALWLFITPYSLLLFVFFILVGTWFLKKGVGFSAKRYRVVSARNKINSYFGSEEHLAFYRILLLPNYITLISVVIVAVSIVVSIVAAKLYFASHGGQVGYMAILTGVAFLQVRSFGNVVLRAGAYNKSLAAIYDVLIAKKARG